HGETRLSRQAIGEGAVYTPLVLRANEIWRQLEDESGHKLLQRCGGLIYGDPSSRELTHNTEQFLQQTVRAAQDFSIEHELLGYSALKKRFPQFRFNKRHEGYFEPGAGYLLPELCIKTQLQLAGENGAQLLFDREVLAIEESQSEVQVKTHERVLKGSKVIICAGSWMPQFLPEKYSSLLKVYRQRLCWFKPVKASAIKSESPVFVKLGSPTEPLVYGFPEIVPGQGMKVASEQFDETISPDKFDRNLSREEVTWLHGIAQNALDLDSTALNSRACLYTMIPDGNFIIDYAPTNKNIIIASPCSGHGFKHSAAIGEMLAAMACEGKAAIKEFSLSRF
ncbi:MAG: N-methyl-L-tryptophan oxidase, partial [Lentisphaeraceae bacterium]|nr:N-methyl-L-tryptophan oxidase [Lentisphaeraceae bacterium]